MIDRCRFIGAGAARRIALGLVFWAAVLAAGPAQARDDVYEVVVPVDVTAQSASEAKTEALADGEREAFIRLLERLTLLEDRGRLPQLGPQGITTLVRDISVDDEKTSGVRYLAKLTVRFKREEIRKLLIDLNIPFAETPSKPALVLPVYQAAGTLMLFDDPNPWREAWAGLPERGNLVPLMLPKGDLSDIAAIGAEQAVQGDRQRLEAIAGRYRAGDVLVAFARLGLDLKTSRPRLDAELVRYGGTDRVQRLTNALTAGPGETPQGLLNRAAKLQARLIEDHWKLDNLMRFDQTGVIAVTIPIPDLKSWIGIRRNLAGVSIVRQVDLVLLSRNEVRANLIYLGRLEQLILALEQSDLHLSKGGDGWILRPLRATQGQKQNNAG
ncbi:MAG: DUF2066 domain-containing protein [Rhodospirillales bacterium]